MALPGNKGIGTAREAKVNNKKNAKKTGVALILFYTKQYIKS